MSLIDFVSGTKHKNRGRRGRDRMVIVLTTIYAISDYHH
jgi:hypothetical protein